MAGDERGKGLWESWRIGNSKEGPILVILENEILLEDGKRYF